jgi:hypothetical protein
MKRQRLAILGATGSIGCSTLDVAARHPERFEIVGLSAYRRIDELAAQCRRFAPRVAVVPDRERAAALREALAGSGVRTRVEVGAEALGELAAAPDVDTVMAAIVGAAAGVALIGTAVTIGLTSANKSATTPAPGVTSSPAPEPPANTATAQPPPPSEEDPAPSTTDTNPPANTETPSTSNPPAKPQHAPPLAAAPVRPAIPQAPPIPPVPGLSEPIPGLDRINEIIQGIGGDLGISGIPQLGPQLGTTR